MASSMHPNLESRDHILQSIQLLVKTRVLSPRKHEGEKLLTLALTAAAIPDVIQRPIRGARVFAE